VSDDSKGRGVIRSVWVLTLVLLASCVTGCQEGEEEIPTEEAQAVVQVAEPASAELLRTLVGRLTAALEEGGAVGALDFCSTEALPLTRQVQAGLGGGLEVKRTSFRVRNPANAPDQAEEEALLHFEEAIGAGGPTPSSYVQRVSDAEYRYYKPLFVAEVCLQCHGAPEALDPEVQTLLSERYPEDLAAGYAVGDFRGVVRVSVPAEGLEARPSEAGS